MTVEMSDDTTDRDLEKELLTEIAGASKEKFLQILPGTSSVESQDNENRRAGNSGTKLDRRAYMQMAGGMATAVAGGALGGPAEAASGAGVNEQKASGTQTYGEYEYGGLSNENLQQ